ncbi:MAG TPA: tetratricopeptide repeat protein [Candidatus Dormibacteraeota bacterium]|nr:tetratricopeptide repeat protein [Candidatus Dormibacteraeota bacterium]
MSVCLVLCLFGAPVSATPRGQQVQSPSLESARQAYEASDYPQAVQILTRAAAGNPRNAEIHLLLAKTYFEMQSNDSAIASAARAVQIDPNNSVYHEWLGKAYGQKAEQAMWFSALSLAKKARKEFGVAVNLDERNFSAQQALIEFDCSAPGIAGGGEDKAKPEIARLSQLDRAEGYYASGNCRRQKKDFSAADAQFTKALEAAPTRAELIFDMGDYAMKREQPERLSAVAELGEKVVPPDPRAGFYRGVALILRKEQPAKTEQLLRDYLEIAPTRTAYPSRAVTHHWLGRLLEQLGQYRAALQEYDAAWKLDPRDKTAKDALKRLGND